MKISIIVPVYNVEPCLRRCLDSLIAQDLSIDEYEIILIDDGSIDNSLLICNGYALEYNNIIVFTQENAGASVARTRGLEYASGEYIFFVDSDDYIENNVLNELYCRATENDCDILFFNYAVVTVNGNSDHRRVFPNIERNVIFSGEYLVCNIKDFGSLWKGFYRRKFIEDNDIHFITGIIHQDTDFNLKAYPFANRLMIVDVNVYYYRFIGESATRTQDVSKRQLIVYSDYVVCKDVKELIDSGKLPNCVAEVYEKLCNSLLVCTTMLLLKHKNIYEEGFIQKCLSYSYEHNLFPIKGKTNSWKTLLLSKTLNLYLICFEGLH